jgi:hypothetical protein
MYEVVVQRSPAYERRRASYQIVHCHGARIEGMGSHFIMCELRKAEGLSEA